MTDFFITPFTFVFTRQAALEMILLAVVCAVIGTFVIVQGLGFLTSALTHAIFPGIVIAYIVAGLGLVFWGGALCGLVVVGTIFATTRSQQVNESTAISVFYVGALALGVVLVSRLKSAGSAQLDNFLFGQLFGVGISDIVTTGIVGGLIVTGIVLLRKELILVSFDRQMARAMGVPTGALELLLLCALVLTVMVGFPAVGNILMIALIVTPPATARLLSHRIGPIMLLAAADSALASLVGLYIAYYRGLAPGAVIVTVLTGIFILTLVVRRVMSLRRIPISA